MEKSEIRALIDAVLPDCSISLDGEGCNFSITAVSSAFHGLPTVQRHRHILGALQQPLASGALHAITVKAYTPEEWEAQARPREAADD